MTNSKGRAGPTGVCPGIRKKFCHVMVLSVLLSLTMAPFLAKRAEAAPPDGCFPPPYLEQLKTYCDRTAEYYRLLEEKKADQRRLEASVCLHKIRPGETLGGIARAYGVTAEALAYWNNLTNPHRIKAGAVLYVLTVEGMLHHVQTGDTLQAVAARYNVEQQLIAGYNLLKENKPLETGTKLVIPGVKTIPGVGADKEGTLLTLASRGKSALPVPPFRWPLTGVLTSLYGWRDGQFHYGLDIAAPYGSVIRAAAAGVVGHTGVQRGYGLMLTIDHGNDWCTLYAHNSRLLVGAGEQVTAGQPIARIGASGNATGPHLHLEIRQNKQKLDPLAFLPR